MLAMVMSSLLSPGKEEGLIVNFPCGNRQQHTIPGCLAVKLPSLVSKYQQRPKKWHSSISFARIKNLKRRLTVVNFYQCTKESLLTRGITWPKTFICKNCMKKRRHWFPTSPGNVVIILLLTLSDSRATYSFRPFLISGINRLWPVAFTFSYRNYK